MPGNGCFCFCESKMQLILIFDRSCYHGMSFLKMFLRLKGKLQLILILVGIFSAEMMFFREVFSSVYFVRNSCGSTFPRGNSEELKTCNTSFPSHSAFSK